MLFAYRKQLLIPLSKLELDYNFCDFFFFCGSIVEFAFLLTKEINGTSKSKVKLQKCKFEPEQILRLRLFLKKTITTYLKIFTTFIDSEKIKVKPQKINRV